MKSVHLLIIIAVLVLAGIGGYIMYQKHEESLLNDPGKIAAAWEAEVQRNMSWMKVNTETIKMLTEKASEKGRTFDQQLRLDAEWYAAKNGFKRPV